uniref:Uncharacterized protein n=1 Tax=Arundo donax TaxID=35708 RepID=A0A0A9FVY4_ARUDO
MPSAYWLPQESRTWWPGSCQMLMPPFVVLEDASVNSKMKSDKRHCCFYRKTFHSGKLMHSSTNGTSAANFYTE